jgi:glycosyltransferase involved in cell wall biosynthesis
VLGESVVPTVSIVVPARNAGRYIAVQLEALATQELGAPWELIVADNGSTDDTREVVRSFIPRFPHAQVVDAGARAGAAYARNVGASVARGEFLCFVDADDRVAPGWLEAMTNGLADTDAVGGPMIAYVEDRKGRQRVLDEGSSELTTNDLGFLPSTPSSNLGVHRAAFDALQGFDETFPGATGEDIDLCWRLQLAGYGLQFVPDARVHYQERPDLAAVARQFFRYGEVMPKLFSNFRMVGMPPSSPGMVTKAWAIALATTLTSWRSFSSRRNWVMLVAQRAGRISGSFKERVLYL